METIQQIVHTLVYFGIRSKLIDVSEARDWSSAVTDRQKLNVVSNKYRRIKLDF